MSSPYPAQQHAAATEPLRRRYERVRGVTLSLTAPLSAEDQVVQAIPEASPAKWHLAHTTWFFERFCVIPLRRNYEPVDRRYEHLFNSYYYTVGDMHDRPRRGLLSRPTVADIRAYRERVDHAMLALIDERQDDSRFAALVLLGLNHEQQHQELLLTDIKQAFFANPLAPAYRELPAPPSLHPAPLKFVHTDEGVFEIGASGRRDGHEFCFDNETPRHRVLVPGHALANRLVTNAEYRDFIDDGGYREPALWLADGWAKIRAEGWTRPLCWSEDLAREFTLAGWRELDPYAPVCHVSYYEADAFARWAKARLPTEAEWELAAAETPVAGNLLDLGLMQPASGNQALRPPPAVRQLWGDVWEWCASSYGPYPGFQPLEGSLGEYNGKFMLNQLVVRGGSCVTWAEHIRPTYRSFFYPHDRWQFLGFRLAKHA
ncbi:MAG TPA: ergothioneine biosynthesis protein EgtB [Gammaproteobacteria bacterium]|nr:ergothioneine biosynthesis protein EgtB [Gammaproteobacteria bacterium]